MESNQLQDALLWLCGGTEEARECLRVAALKKAYLNIGSAQLLIKPMSAGTMAATAELIGRVVYELEDTCYGLRKLIASIEQDAAQEAAAEEEAFRD